jgi:hypothetical protein
MADSFDPYHKWLGISPKDQPANHYRLLGIELFETDADVIEGAADQRMSHVRTFQAGQNSALSQRLLNELSAAKLCLLTPQKKADYDRQLRERMAPVDNSLRAPMAAPAQQRAAVPIATVLPQAAPLPATPAAPIIMAGNQDLGASTYRPHRKTPLWRQPALLGTAGALVLFAAIAYFLASSGKLPTEASVTQKSTNTVPADPSKTKIPAVPAREKPDISPADAAPAMEPPSAAAVPSQGNPKVELTPLAPEKSPMLVGESGSPAPLAGAPVDLLKQVDVANDAVEGEWKRTDEAIVSPAKSGARLMLPYEPSGDYELIVVAERLAGSDSFVLGLVIGGRQIAMTLDGYGGETAGLADLDGHDGAGNETTRRGRLLPPGKAHNIVCAVSGGKLSVTCDGENVITWSGDPSRLSNSVFWTVPNERRLFLGAWESEFKYTRIELKPAPTALAGRAVDLLKQVDVAKDTVEGEWKRTDEALVSPAKSGARLMLPYSPSGDYELTVVAERLSGNDSFVLGLVIGGRQIAMTLDGYGGETAGLADVDGHDGATNETTRRGRHLPPGKPHTIVCAVSGARLRVTCDGNEVLTWSGDASRLANDVGWSVPNDRRLFLGAWESEFKYTRIEVKPMPAAALAASEGKGSSAQMNPAAPSNVEPPRRRFSDLSSEGGGDKLAAVPDDESLKKARQEMQKNFSSSMKAARTPDLKRSLSQEMAEKASLEEKGGAYAYALFNQAIDLAEATGDLDLAWKIIDQLAGSFDVDGMDLRNRSLVGAGKAARTPERAWELADAACRLMLAALKAGDAAAVQKAGKQAELFAKRTKDKSVQKLVAAHADDAAKLAGEIDAVEKARETLKTMPLDAHANQVVGHYELCATGNWNAALPKLARSDDSEWRKLAQSEQSLGDLADPARQLSTADGWWSLAEEAPWPGKHYLQMRAGKRYAAAHRSLVDVGRVRAADRIKMLLALDDGLPNWELFNWRGFQANQPIGEIARVENGRSLETAVEYDGAIDVILVARATGTKIRLHSHNWSWNWDFVVEPNRWHTLRYTITPFLRTAMLDGLLVHTDGSRTARRLNSAPVYISAFNDEIIEVKKFVVRGL